MKAYITLVAILLGIGLLIILGQLDGALDGKQISSTTCLVGSIFCLYGVHYGVITWVFYKEELIEVVRELLEVEK